MLKSGINGRALIGRRERTRPNRKRRTVRASKADLASRPPTIRIGKQTIKFKPKLRYLGVHFGNQMSVSPHCSHIGNRTMKLFGKLARLASSQWKLQHKILSTLFRGVFTPIAEYAASGCADLCSEADLKKLRAAQRQALLAVTRA